MAKELASVLFTYYLTCKDRQCSSHARPGVRCKQSRVSVSVETADGEVEEGPVLGKSLKLSGNKAELIGRLLSYWAHSFADDSDREHSAAQCCEIPSFRQICAWNKNHSYLCYFSFRQLYEYLVNNKDKTFDKKGMKAYKSLKAYKYFKDGFIWNVWSNSHKETQLVAVRAHCFCEVVMPPSMTHLIVT